MTKHEKAFIKTVWEYYRRHGRRSLPWRKTTNPYRILVSEVMLQQTQVDRVLPKYTAFLKRFSTFQKLADAPLKDVLIQWRGLGYNRRAKMLHNCAKEVVKNHNGKLPRQYEQLKTLPGIGPYTAGAVMAFAFNEPIPIIETNIRTVCLHHFFKNKNKVSDASLSRLIAIVLDKENPREWYWALMDYGAHLKKIHNNPSRRSVTYKKQSRFEGSDRQIRGAILRCLGERPSTKSFLHTTLPQFQKARVNTQLKKLVTEEMVAYVQGKYQLPS